MLRKKWPGLVLALALGAIARGEATERWPTFLPPPSAFPPAIAAGVERVWP